MPHIARFRAAFGAKLRFAVIHYPVWQELAAADCSFDALSRSVADQIGAHVGTAQKYGSASRSAKSGATRESRIVSVRPDACQERTSRR